MVGLLSSTDTPGFAGVVGLLRSTDTPGFAGVVRVFSSTDIPGFACVVGHLSSTDTRRVLMEAVQVLLDWCKSSPVPVQVMLMCCGPL